MSFLRTQRELVDQGRLAAASLAGDEGHPTLSGQGEVEKSIQAFQLLVPGDKDGPLDG